MALWNTASHYGKVTKWLHWSIALLFFMNFALGITHEPLSEHYAALKEILPRAHATIGILLMLLVILRLVVNQIQISPAVPPTLSPLEARLAHLMKILLNTGLLLTALLGVATLNTKGEGVPFLYLTLPPVFPKQAEYHELAEEAHEFFAYFLMLLVMLHSAAALKHHVVNKDNVLKRMLP